MAKKKGDLTHDNTRNEPLTDDQRQALFFQHKNKIAALKVKLASVNGDLRQAYKTAKSEGFPKKDFDFAFMLEKDEDDAAINERRRQAEIAAWMSHPIGTQSDLFGSNDSDPRSMVERAAAEGKKAGMEGKPCDPPYSDQETSAAWVEAWHLGQAAIFDIKKTKDAEEAPLIQSEDREEGGVDAFDEAASSDDGDGESPPWPDDVAAEREPAETL